MIEEILKDFDKKFYPLVTTGILEDTFKNGIFWGRKRCLEEVKVWLVKENLNKNADK